MEKVHSPIQFPLQCHNKMAVFMLSRHGHPSPSEDSDSNAAVDTFLLVNSSVWDTAIAHSVQQLSLLLCSSLFKSSPQSPQICLLYLCSSFSNNMNSCGLPEFHNLL